MEDRIGYCGIIGFVRFQDEQESYMGFGTELDSNTTIERLPHLFHTSQQVSQSRQPFAEHDIRPIQ